MTDQAFQISSVPHRLRLPKYRLHKASGQAVVTLRGRDVYLGEYNTPASHEKYQATIAEFIAGRGVRERVQQRHNDGNDLRQPNSNILGLEREVSPDITENDLNVLGQCLDRLGQNLKTVDVLRISDHIGHVRGHLFEDLPFQSITRIQPPPATPGGSAR